MHVRVSVGQDQRPLWTDALEPYIKNTGVLICPSDANRVMSGQYSPAPTVKCGYGAYCWHFGQPSAIYHHASDTVILTDATSFRTHVPSVVAQNSPGAPTACQPNGSVNWVHARHMEMANFLFLDGHVKAYNRSSSIAIRSTGSGTDPSQGWGGVSPPPHHSAMPHGPGCRAASIGRGDASASLSRIDSTRLHGKRGKDRWFRRVRLGRVARAYG